MAEEKTEKPDGRTAAGKLATAEATIAERDRRIAELEEAQTSPTPMAEGAEETAACAKYMVVAVGCPYRIDGSEAHIETAMRGQVVSITDDEAARLLHLGAIRAATPEEIAAEPIRAEREAQIAAERAIGPIHNPYGGRYLQSQEDHAAEQIALAKANGTLAADA